MNMRFRLMVVGRTERGFVSEGVEHYVARIRKRATLDEVVIPEHKGADPETVKRMEGKAVLAALGAQDHLVVLDERGRSLTSEGFAAELRRVREGGQRGITFLVGGSFGHSEEVRQRASLVLSLSPMTFPHQLVRVLFAEQLYRALSIIGGSPYHH